MGDSDPLMEFIAVTEADPEVATRFLEACNWDVQEAVQQFLENPARYIEDSAPHRVAPDDSVRAPIAPKKMVLMDQFPDQDDDKFDFQARRQPARRPRAVFEGFRDLRSESLQAMQQMSHGAQGKKAGTTKVDRLAELFRPPIEIIFSGSYDAAKRQAERKEKWLLVNIQDETEFDSQRLNRDTWKDPAVKELIKQNFVFWQTYVHNDIAQAYIPHYPIQRYPHISIIDPRTGEMLWSQDGFLEPPKMLNELKKQLKMLSYPGDDIDTRHTSHPSRDNTGSIVVDSDDEDAELKRALALSRESSAVSTSQQAQPPSTSRQASSMDFMSEEEQLAAAIQASLQDDAAEQGSGNNKNADSSSDEEEEEEDDDEEGAARSSSQKKRKASDEAASVAVAPLPAKRSKSGETQEAKTEFKSEFPVPLEDDPSKSKDCTIQLRLPNGSVMTKQFYSNDLVGAVAYILQTEAGMQCNLTLSTPFPRKTFTLEEMLSLTLADAKLTPRAVLVVEVDG